MLRAIREIQPRYVVGENVPGIVNWNGGLVFDEVRADLENEGYEVWPVILPACAVNAPHRRDRVWFVAYRSSTGRKARINTGQGQGNEGFERFSDMGVTSYTTGDRLERERPRSEAKEGLQQRPESTGKLEMGFEGLCEKRDVANADSIGFTGEKYWKEKSGFNGQFSIQPSWHNFPTQSPVCGRNDEFSPKLDGITFSKWRNESIKAYGNAIVPSLVYQIFKTIQVVYNAETPNR